MKLSNSQSLELFQIATLAAADGGVPGFDPTSIIKLLNDIVVQQPREAIDTNTGISDEQG